MQFSKLHWRRMSGCALVLLLTSGCFQAVGGDGLQGTPVAQQVETLPPLPTLAPITEEPSPTIDEATDEPLPFEELTDEPAEEPTEEPFVFEQPTEEADAGGGLALTTEVVDVPLVEETEAPFIEPDATAVVLAPTETEAFIAPLPTETNTPFPTSTPQPTNTLVSPENLTGGGDAMLLLTAIETQATATPAAIVAVPTATPTLDPVALTLTSIAGSAPQVVQIPSATPTLDPVAVTLTFIAGGVVPQVAQLSTPTPEFILPQEEQPVQEQPLDPIAITATFIVERATQTAAAPLTLTAVQGGNIPTLTPSVDPNLLLTVQAAQTQIGVEDSGATAPPQPLAPGSDCWHEVRRGETLYRLATTYGLTVEEIAAANGVLNVDLIAAGRALQIPGCGTSGVTPPPTSTPRATPGQGGGSDPNVTPAPPSGRSHIVRTGETLFQISLIYGATVEGIVAANPEIRDINIIFIGQRLAIP